MRGLGMNVTAFKTMTIWTKTYPYQKIILPEDYIPANNDNTHKIIK